MAGYVLTIAGGKGGVGKTTTAVNLAAAFASDDHDTVVLDADLGMPNLARTLSLEHDTSVHAVLADEASAETAVTDGPGGTAILPGEESLSAYADAEPSGLGDLIRTLADEYEVVLVDTGTGLSHETTVALGAADGIVLCTTADAAATGDALRTAELAEMVDGRVLGCLVTHGTGDGDLEAVQAAFDVPILGVVPLDVDAAEDEPVVETAPETHMATAYRELASQLERVVFEGAESTDLIQVFEPSWFASDAPATEEDTEEDTEDEEEGRSGGFGLFG